MSRAAGNAPAPSTLLNLEVIHGDITQVADGDVYVAGHYIDVTPQFAEEALDEIVSDASLRWVKGDESKAEVLQLKRSRRVIHALTIRRAIRGTLGEVYLFPMAGWHAADLDSAQGGERRAPRMIAIAGMGYMGAFGVSELRRLGQAVAGTVARLPDRNRICSVLIGSGFGNLPVEQAVFELVSGVADGIRETAPGRLITLAIVERNIGRAHQIFRVAKERFSTDSNVALLEPGPTVRKGARISADDAYVLSIASLATLAAQGKAGTAALANAIKPAVLAIDKTINTGDEIRSALSKLADVEDIVLDTLVDLEVRVRRPASHSAAPTRLTCVREMDEKGRGILSLAALSSTAVVPKRFNPVDWNLVLDVVGQLEALGEENAPDREANKFPGLLRQILIPRDFRDYVTSNGGPADAPLVFELDRQTAMVHWEVLDTGASDTTSAPVAIRRPVSRQLRTEYSSAPGARAPNDNRLGVLLIAAPGDPDDERYLPGALTEVEFLAGLLADMVPGLTIDILASDPHDPHRAGHLADAPAASRLEVLQRLLSTRQYDIVHYSGHGFFDEADPTKSGWEFTDGVLTANELGGLDTVPQLVVANACQSAKTARAGSRRRDRSIVRDHALAPSLADEFFKRGVRAYVGTAWSIADDAAVQFARHFYETLLLERTTKALRRELSAGIGDSMLAARQQLWSTRGTHGLAWAAYQHYGDPTMQIVVPGSHR